MLNLLAIALAAVQAQPSVPNPATAPPDSAAPRGDGVIEGDFRILTPGAKQEDMNYATTGGLPHFLAFGCDSTAGISVLLSLNANVGYSMPGAIAGGHRVRYAFDGGREQGNRWASVGDTVIARAAASRPLEFIRTLRGSRSVRFRVQTQRGEVVLAFRYGDPAAVVDEIARRCNVDVTGDARRR